MVRRLTHNQIQKMNKKMIRETEKEYKEFLGAIKQEKCYLCNHRLTFFNREKPCPHWLLRPAGFNKRYFLLVTKYFDYFQIQAYLKWLANYESLFGNINNLIKEKPDSKLFEYTILYKQFEWSFSCSYGDFKGHKGREAGDTPHYHFQMKIEDEIFICYSDFHIPFTKQDLWVFDVIAGKYPQIRYVSGYSTAVQEVIGETDADLLLDRMSFAKDDNKAPFRMETLIEAEKGHKIYGDNIARLLKERDKSGTPMARLVKKLKNVKARTAIMPSDNIPGIASRKGGRGKK